MEATIQGIKVTGTPQEIAEMIKIMGESKKTTLLPPWNKPHSTKPMTGDFPNYASPYKPEIICTLQVTEP